MSNGPDKHPGAVAVEDEFGRVISLGTFSQQVHFTSESALPHCSLLASLHVSCKVQFADSRTSSLFCCQPHGMLPCKVSLGESSVLLPSHSR